MKRKFNPFYNDKFLIITDTMPHEKRYLIELSDSELKELQFQVGSVINERELLKKAQASRRGYQPIVYKVSPQRPPKSGSNIYKSQYVTRRCVALIPTLEAHKFTEKWTCMNCNAEISETDTTRCPTCGYKFID